MTSPNKIGIGETYLVEPMRRLIEGCVESGIWATLWSTVDHLQILDRIKFETTSYKEQIDSSNNTPPYEFLILVIGLLIATIFFGIELLLGKYGNTYYNNI